MENLKTQFGESATADFEENTWTFEMKEDYKVIAGEFAIVPKNEYLELLESFNETQKLIICFNNELSRIQDKLPSKMKIHWNELINKISK